MQARAQSCCESCWSAQTMSLPEQSVLQRAWSQAPRGRLSPWMEAKAWGLREGWRDLHDGSEHGMLTWIAKRVTKGGGGNPTVESVGKPAKRASKRAGGRTSERASGHQAVSEPASERASEQASVRVSERARASEPENKRILGLGVCKHVSTSAKA